MNNVPNDIHRAAIPLFTPVLAPMFTTLPFRCHPSSRPLFLIHRDGTDPLFGGHEGSCGGRHVVSGRQGGAA
jgi:hypothetical protein